MILKHHMETQIQQVYALIEVYCYHFLETTSPLSLDLHYISCNEEDAKLEMFPSGLLNSLLSRSNCTNTEISGGARKLIRTSG